MSEEKQFVDGLIVKPPHEKAPDFVKASISIKRKDLGNWLRGKDDDWINVDVKESKQGKWYAEVNNWKPDSDKKQDGHNEAKSNGYQPDRESPKAGEMDDDIPFMRLQNEYCY